MLRDFIAGIRTIAVALAAAAIVSVPLASCGVKGPLVLPPPAAGAAGDAPGARTPPPDGGDTASAPKAPEVRP